VDDDGGGGAAVEVAAAELAPDGRVHFDEGVCDALRNAAAVAPAPTDMRGQELPEAGG
jgi:hypothetical protein